MLIWNDIERNELMYHLVGFDLENSNVIQNKSNSDYIATLADGQAEKNLYNNELDSGSTIPLVSKEQENDPVTDLVTPLAETLVRLMEVLGNEEKGIVQLGIELSVADKKNIRKTYIEPALKLGLIERTIPEKPTSPNQKYRKIKH
ncbi:Fic family protein [[Mannheimia] succiniciproducens]|nr:hypothetical protein [[Mannheimia] succiniciproducens]